MRGWADTDGDSSGQTDCEAFIVGITQTDTAMPFRRRRAGYLHHAEQSLSFTGKTELFAFDVPVVSLDNLGSGFDHVNVRNRTPGRTFLLLRP